MPDSDPTSVLGDRRFRWIRPAILIVVPLALLLPVLLSGDLLYGADMLNIFYYSRSLVVQALREGRLPIWDSTSLAGFPLLAGVQAAVFYPPSWLCLLLPSALFWTLSTALHLSLSGFFAERWLRQGLGIGAAGALLGALLYMGSGFLAGHLNGGHVNHVWAYPWMAGVLAGLEAYLAAPSRKRGMALGASAAMLVLAGVPQYFYFACSLVGLRLIHYLLETRQGRRDRAILAGKTAGWLFWSLLICAAQILPTLELLPLTQRGAETRPEFYSQYSLPPENLLTLVAPAFFGDQVGVPYWGRWYLWEICGSLGGISLLLAGLSLGSSHRQRHLWLGVAAGSLGLALGRYFFLYPLFFRLVPGSALFRSPGRFLLPMTLALLPLIGLGFDRFRRDMESMRRALIAASLTAGGMASGLLLFTSLLTVDRWARILDWARSVPDSGLIHLVTKPDFAAASLAGARFSLIWAAAVLGIGALVFAAGAARRGKGWALATALGVLAIVDVYGFSRRYVIRQSNANLLWPAEFIRFIKECTGNSYRLATLGTAPLPVLGNCQVAGIDYLGGYEPMLLRPYAEFMNAAHGAPPDTPFVARASMQPGPALDLLGARIWIVWDTRVKTPGWKLLGKVGGGLLYENPNALPRAWLVDHAVVLESAGERLKTMTEGPFNPAKTVILHQFPGDAPPVPTGRAGAAAIVGRSPGRFDIETDAAADAYLVLAEAWVPGWSAEIDGRPVEVLPADHLIQAIRVPPGKHRVHWTYRSRFLVPGLAVSLLALLVPLGMMFRKPKAAAPATPS